MRGVIRKTILAFQDGKVSKKEVGHLLRNHFSDKTFQDILQCAQGQLNKCKKIDLRKWQRSATKEVEDIARKAKKRNKIDQDKKT